MKNCSKFLMVFLALSLFSCECSYQYNVYIENETGKSLKLTYKTLNDVKGEIAKNIILKPGEYRRIITTKDLSVEGGCTGTQASHCGLVAEYVDAFIDEDVPSKIKWCGDQIDFQKADIQQGEFIITYKLEDF